MRKLIEYFRRSTYDLIVLMIVIAIAIKMYNENILAFAILCFYGLYIFSTIIRLGQSIDLLDEFIYNKNIRSELGLGPYPGSINKQKKTFLFKMVHILYWIAFISILVIFVLDKK